MCICLIIAPLDKHASPFSIESIQIDSGLIAERSGRGAISLRPEGECACGFVADKRATEPDWKVRADLKEKLIKAIESATKNMKRFRVMATWMGEPAKTETTISMKALCSLIRNEPFGGRSYIVNHG
jgi:hypothetical protein